MTLSRRNWAAAAAQRDPAHRRPHGRPGRPRKRPAKLHGDKGYDCPKRGRPLRAWGITPRIARRGIESTGRL